MASGIPVKIKDSDSTHMSYSSLMSIYEKYSKHDLSMKEKLPLVSIIIPVFNSEKWLNQCVSSVINQTYKNLEIILVDDISEDNSRFLCDKLSQTDKRIKVIHKNNEGVSAARNTGIEIMTGEYVLFVDSDDTIENKMVETMLIALIKSNSDAAVCLEEHDNDAHFKNNLYINLLRDNIGSQVWRWLFNANLLRDDRKIRFPTYQYAEDMFFMQEIIYRKKICLVNQRLYNYNQSNPFNTSNNPRLILKNINGRAIAFIYRYIWINDKDNIDNETKNIILSKATDLSLSTLARWNKQKNNIDNYELIYNFLSQNKKIIQQSILLPKKLRIKIRLYYLNPKLFKKLGFLLVKK